MELNEEEKEQEPVVEFYLKNAENKYAYFIERYCIEFDVEKKILWKVENDVFYWFNNESNSWEIVVDSMHNYKINDGEMMECICEYDPDNARKLFIGDHNRLVMTYTRFSTIYTSLFTKKHTSEQTKRVGRTREKQEKNKSKTREKQDQKLHKKYKQHTMQMEQKEQEVVEFYLKTAENQYAYYLSETHYLDLGVEKKTLWKIENDVFSWFDDESNSWKNIFQPFHYYKINDGEIIRCLNKYYKDSSCFKISMDVDNKLVSSFKMYTSLFVEICTLTPILK